MSRPKPKKKKPAGRKGKRYNPARKRGEVLLRSVQAGLLAQMERRRHPLLVPGREPGVVCEKCGLEQPYQQGRGCIRGELLPGLPCDGEYAVPADQFVVEPAPSSKPGDGNHQAAEKAQSHRRRGPVPAGPTR